MIEISLLENFVRQFEDLKRVVGESRDRSISDPPDELFYKYQNVFIKSYLVSACSILEAFIQDLLCTYLDEMQSKINKAKIPHNFIAWAAENDRARMQSKTFESERSRKDVSDLISPNYWKTIKAFERLGVNIALAEVEFFKEIVTSRVEKRNKIVHHNDAALDLSFTDIIKTIDSFSAYMKCLFEVVSNDPHL